MEKTVKPNIKALEQKAINLALKANWKEAILVNTEILVHEPENSKAYLRLGLANLQTKNFKEAEKLFRKVLKLDPINSVAKKNLESAKAHKTEKLVDAASTKKLIKEPGTSAEAKMIITAPRTTAESFVKGEELSMKINKNSIVILKDDKILGTIESPIVNRIHQAKEQKSKVTVEYSHGKDKDIVVLFRSESAVFKAERQDVKPYMKKGSLDEDEEESSEEE